MSGRFWLIIGVIAAIFVGAIFFTGDKDKKDSGDQQAVATSHVKGKTDSKVTLVEYGDFQCPICGVYYPLVKEIYAKYKDRIAFQFRNLPLTQIHNNAFAASRAAEAASKQNKFWEMHDYLYENQTTWSASNSPLTLFKQYAERIGLDLAKFETDFASNEVNRSINADINAFKATKNDLSTPTFFLNGKKMNLKEVVNAQGQPELEKFSAKIDEALKQQ